MEAQTVTVWQVHGLVTTAADPFVGAGTGVGIRPRGRLGVGLTASGGTVGGEPGVRIEGLANFHLDPARRRGTGLYVGGGVAVVASGAGSREFLALLVGLEATPGGRRGWFVEAGVAGGMRLTAGFRFRG